MEAEKHNTLAELEKVAILGCLYRLDGNLTQTAKELGISVDTLRRRLDQFEAEDYRNLLGFDNVAD